VVEDGALADLLLVDGDPIGNLKLIDPGKSLVVIMKDDRLLLIRLNLFRAYTCD
jgi:imidazolonepropionase-like amidohydrolase